MLIVIEGVDGSGKQTQTELLYQKLSGKARVKKLTFPNYDSQSSALVKMYLNGDFGSDPAAVNPYAASVFYAADRVATYLGGLKEDFDSGTVIIADRYTTSNAVHQAGKLEGKEKDDFLNWLFHFEYGLLGLPKPDVVFFLNMPPEYSKKLTAMRKNKITGGDIKDIHENDESYITASYNNALTLAKNLGWVIIDCVKGGEIRAAEDISREITNMVVGIT